MCSAYQKKLTTRQLVDIQCFFSSDITEDKIIKGIDLEGGDNYLSNPITQQVLSAKLWAMAMARIADICTKLEATDRGLYRARDKG